MQEKTIVYAHYKVVIYIQSEPKLRKKLQISKNVFIHQFFERSVSCITFYTYTYIVFFT